MISSSGAIFVDDLDEVPEGVPVVFSAHGVPKSVPAEAERREMIYVDATCPLVSKVHREAERHHADGRMVALIGHASHPEIIGTMGQLPDGAVTLVETQEQAKVIEFPDPAQSLAYITQTTLSVDDTAEIVATLQHRFPDIQGPRKEDICYATTNRQHAVRILAPSADLVLVVGSRNSSNSVRLTEIAENVGTPARLIDDVTELNEAWFASAKTVLITAGASAPEDLVRGLIHGLIDRFGGELEQHHVDREDVEFGLPGTLKKLMRERGIDPTNRSIRMNIADEIDRWLNEENITHSTIDLTIGVSE